MRVYISGPITGMPFEKTLRVFSVAGVAVLTHGDEPITPFTNGLPVSADWREHMRADIKMLVDCDAIYMIGNWWMSNKAKLEFDIAMKIGLLDYATQVVGHDPMELIR